MTTFHDQPPMSRRAAREFERRQEASAHSGPSAAAASTPEPPVVQDAVAQRAAVPATPVTPSSVAYAASAAVPASAVYAPDGRLLTRREARAARAAMEAELLTPLVEPGAATDDGRSGIAAPVSLPSVVAPREAPALPPEAATATSVPVVHPEPVVAAPPIDSTAAAAVVSAPTSSSPVLSAPMQWAPMRSAPVASAPVPAATPVIASTPLTRPAVNEPTVLEPTVIEPAATPDLESAQPEVAVDSATPVRAADDDATESPFRSFETTDVSGTSISTSALVLPSIPGHADLPRALDGTGEILITGTLNLPTSLAETGSHYTALDGVEVDRLLEADDRVQVSTSSQPVRATRAVSTHTATRGIIQPKRPKTNRLLTALAITASALAVGVVALLVIGVLNGLF